MLLAAAGPILAEAKELAYPEGLHPGMQVSGTEGEYYRYKNVLVKPPDDDDRIEALKMSEDFKCRACEILVESLLQRAESHSEDHIMDQFDGELQEEVDYVENPQENRVNRNRKGCNKHFKDEILLQGWMPKRCSEPDGTVDSTPAEERPWCLEQRGGKPTERDVDTYSVRNEAAFYACENTVGRYGLEIASFLAERLEDGGDGVKAAVGDACRQEARCGGNPRRRKKSESSSGGGSSDAAKKRRRRRRKAARGDL